MKFTSFLFKKNTYNLINPTFLMKNLTNNIEKWLFEKPGSKNEFCEVVSVSGPVHIPKTLFRRRFIPRFEYFSNVVFIYGEVERLRFIFQRFAKKVRGFLYVFICKKIKYNKRK